MKAEVVLPIVAASAFLVFLLIQLRPTTCRNTTTCQSTSTSSLSLQDQERLATVLKKATRSYAASIALLPHDMVIPISVLYLCLRGMDTVEDDLKLPLADKIKYVQKFPSMVAQGPFVMQGVGTVDGHRNVLEKFDVVSRAYMSLTPAQQRVIVHNLNETSQGMVKYLQHPIVTMNDYNDYCYFVAGTVGIAISNMYLVTGYPLPAMDNHHRQHCINVGLLLQKVNIIRDVREDTMEGRRYWPKALWEPLVPDIRMLLQPKHRSHAIHCLNALIQDAMQHVPPYLEFLQTHLKDVRLFPVHTIPVVSGIAMLRECYNNPAVFVEENKIHLEKGTLRSVQEACTSIEGIQQFCHGCLNTVRKKSATSWSDV